MRKPRDGLSASTTAICTARRWVRATVEENVVVQLGNLRSLPSVASRLMKGNLELHGWVYEFETGEVFAYEPSRRKFVPLAERLLSDDYESAAAHASSVILLPR